MKLKCLQPNSEDETVNIAALQLAILNERDNEIMPSQAHRIRLESLLLTFYSICEFDVHISVISLSFSCVCRFVYVVLNQPF